MYFVYIIRCKDDTLYTGITTDIERRFREHSGEAANGAKYTRSHRPERIEAVWKCPDRSAASKLEYALKKLRRPQKIALICGESAPRGIPFPDMTMEANMIREIGLDDVSECVRVIRESFMTVADEFGFTQENAPLFTAFAVDEAKIVQWRDEQHRPMYGYYEGGKLVGYYNLLVSGDECELGSLCVLPEYRHKGAGDALLSDALSRAKLLGCTLMKLSIVEENTVLRQWYEKHGFIHTGTRKFDFFPFTCGYLEIKLH